MAKFKNALKFIIPLVLAIILIRFVINSIDIKALWGRISEANFTWVITGVVISLLAHLSRAYRWKILMEPLGFNPSLKNTFLAVMVGYFGNVFLPRGGEVMRCMVLTKVDKVPFNSSFGTVVAERAFDFVCLLFLMACSLLLEFERFSQFFSENVFKKKEGPQTLDLLQNTVFIGLVATGILLIISFFIFRKRIIQSSLFFKLKTFAIGLLQGVLSIRKLERRGEFIIHSLLIWIGYFLMTYLMFFALPSTSHLDLVAGLVILIVGGLGMSAPVSGGIGPFHAMVAKALQLFYGLDYDDGVAYAFVIHTSQLISILLVGGLCSMLVLLISKKNPGIIEDTK